MSTLKPVQVKYTLDDFLPLDILVRRYPQFSINQLRWMIQKRKTNGLEGCIKRVGRRLYFCMPLFLKWIDSQ